VSLQSFTFEIVAVIAVVVMCCVALVALIVSHIAKTQAPKADLPREDIFGEPVYSNVNAPAPTVRPPIPPAPLKKNREAGHVGPPPGYQSEPPLKLVKPRVEATPRHMPPREAPKPIDFRGTPADDSSVLLAVAYVVAASNSSSCSSDSSASSYDSGSSSDSSSSSCSSE
jgi:hypothetical protein